MDFLVDAYNREVEGLDDLEVWLHTCWGNPTTQAGVISHRNLQVETPDEAANDNLQVVRYIDPDQLVLSTDCGFGRQGCDRLLAFHRTVSMVQGANDRSDADFHVASRIDTGGSRTTSRLTTLTCARLAAVGPINCSGANGP